MTKKTQILPDIVQWFRTQILTDFFQVRCRLFQKRWSAELIISAAEQEILTSSVLSRPARIFTKPILDQEIQIMTAFSR